MSANLKHQFSILVLVLVALTASACAATAETAADAVRFVDDNPTVAVTAEPIDSSPGAAVAAPERELVAVVDAINGNVWTINGQSFLLTPQTEVKGSPAVGDRVKVHFSALDDGTLRVREVELTTAAASQSSTSGASSSNSSSSSAAGSEFDGAIEAINGNVWTIAGRQVTVTAATELKGSFSAGDQVKVHTLLQADGALVAREIEPLHAGDDSRDDGEDEFYGVVEAMSASVWTVSGRQVTVTLATELKDSIAVGSRVKVHALAQADGSLVAREIELDDDSDDDWDDDDDRDDDSDDDQDDDSDDDQDDDSDEDHENDSDDDRSDDDRTGDNDDDDDVNDDDDDDDDDD